MSDKKVNQISDEQLIKCMKDYLEWPTKYHPEYLGILLRDYERRVIAKLTDESPAPPLGRTTICSTLTNLTTGT